MKTRNKLYLGNKPAQGRLVTSYETWDLYQIRLTEPDNLYVHCKIISRVERAKANFRIDWVRGTQRFIANGNLKMLREHDHVAVAMLELELKLIFPPVVAEDNVVYLTGRRK